MILVIDTSSSRSTLSIIDSARGSRHDAIFGSREPGPSLGARLREEVPDLGAITKIAIATGPGSFTGLRVGVSFGLGLAMGLGVPIVPLPTLELQAARGGGRFTAVSEAGRGRFYFLAPGGSAAAAAPDGIPRDRQLVGLLSTESELALRNAGHTIASYREVQTVAEAAEKLLETAREVPYRNLEITYMQSFSPRVS